MKISSLVLLVGVIVVCNSFNVYATNDRKITIDEILTKELYYPGRIETKDFYITNNKPNNISIDRLYIQLKSSKDLTNNQLLDINSKQFKELSSNSTVKLYYNGNILLQDRLESLLSKKGIVLPQKIDINSNEKALLNMTIDMDEEMNNYAQALENIFSIGVAYKIDNTNPPIDPGEPDKEIPLIPLEPSKPIDPTNPDPPVKPGTGVGGETDENRSDKLPQTGGLINSTSLLALGTIAIGTGIVLNKKSSKEKGGKHHE